jgi:hypothetical protein
MVFGHNSNIKFGANIFHVQTEDRGESHALIDTTVYYQGRVLHRRTNNYLDLLPLNDDTVQALKLRVDEQHRVVLEAIRSGELQLTVPPSTLGPTRGEMAHNPEPNPQVEQSPLPDVQQRKLVLELLNARSWLSGRNATLLLAVKDESGTPVQGVQVLAEIEGSAGHPPYTTQTGNGGQATISFEMPKLVATEAALVIRAEEKNIQAQLRFTLRAKPRVPAV